MEQSRAIQKRQEPRLPVEITSRYRTGSGQAHIVRVSNLSRSGCMLHQNYSALSVGRMLTIRLGEIGPIDSVVRWKDGLNVGLEFITPLHPAMMDHLTRQYGIIWEAGAA